MIFWKIVFLNERGELKSQCKENLEKCITSLFPGKMNETFARRVLDFYLDRKKPLNEQITKLEQVTTLNDLIYYLPNTPLC